MNLVFTWAHNFGSQKACETDNSGSFYICATRLGKAGELHPGEGMGETFMRDAASSFFVDLALSCIAESITVLE